MQLHIPFQGDIVRPLIVAAFCLAAVQVEAQTAQTTPSGPTAMGSKIVSGSARLARVSFDDGTSKSSSTLVSVTPSALWFVRDRVALGGTTGLTYSSFEAASAWGWLLGPAARVFLTTTSERVLPFVGAAFSMGRTYVDFDGSSSESSSYGFEVMAGAIRMLTRNVGVTSEVYMSRMISGSQSRWPSRDITATDMGLRFGVSAFVY